MLISHTLLFYFILLFLVLLLFSPLHSTLPSLYEKKVPSSDYICRMVALHRRGRGDWCNGPRMTEPLPSVLEWTGLFGGRPALSAPSDICLMRAAVGQSNEQT